MFQYSVLLATALAAPEFSVPDFSVFVNAVEVPIECKLNKETINQLEVMQMQTFLGVSPLRTLRQKGTITEEQNKQLFGAELLASGIDQVIAAHRFAEYFCEHPEKLPSKKVDIGV